MERHFRRTFLLFGLALLATENWIVAGDGCAHCGCHSTCRKICRLVCEEKKVDTVCWGCKVEDFCLPNPSKPGCTHREQVCDESCDPKLPLSQSKTFTWKEWIPCSAKVYTKKKLMKKVVTQKVPSFKWVVEDLCEHCEARCEFASVTAGTEVPTPPVSDAVFKYGLVQTPIPSVEVTEGAK